MKDPITPNASKPLPLSKPAPLSTIIPDRIVSYGHLPPTTLLACRSSSTEKFQPSVLQSERASRRHKPGPEALVIGLCHIGRVAVGVDSVTASICPLAMAASVAEPPLPRKLTPTADARGCEDVAVTWPNIGCVDMALSLNIMSQPLTPTRQPAIECH